MDDYKNPVLIDEHYCNGCGVCTFVCSMGVLELREKPGTVTGKVAVAAKPEYCMQCEACVIDCKNGAIRLNAQTLSLNIEKISDHLIKKKKSIFKFWKK